MRGISSREWSGFSIGENGGNNATLLGLRTLTADVRIDDLNLGHSSQGDPGAADQRDGSVVGDVRRPSRAGSARHH